MSQPSSSDSQLRRLRQIARVMDAHFGIPFTKVRFGADSLIGLIPGIGDIATTVISAYIWDQGRRMGVSRGTQVRMLGNIAVDLVVGAVPVLGDIADVFIRSNRRNVDLIEKELATKGELRRVKPVD